MAGKKTFLILDGNALLHRAWHAIPPLTTKDGRVVNAAYGFTNVIEKMLKDFSPDAMAVAWDLPGGTFRHEEYKEYKATRVKQAQELYDQIPIIQEILTAYGIPSISSPGFEADDIIGTLATKNAKHGFETLIVTGDLDSLQLVDSATKVVCFVKGLSEIKTYDDRAVKERYGLPPSKLIDYKALIGDNSDNLPGVSGIGPKTALELLQTHGSLKGIFSALKSGKLDEKFAKKLKGKEKEAGQMERLVTIVRDCPLPDFAYDDAVLKDRNVDALVSLFRDLEFRNLLKKYTGEDTGHTKKTSHKKKPAPHSAASLADLSGHRFALVVERKAHDLFGGTIAAIAVDDGHTAFVVSEPSTHDVVDIIAFLAHAEEIVGHDIKTMFHTLATQAKVDALLSVRVFDTMVAAYLLAPGGRDFDFRDVLHEELREPLSANASLGETASAVLRLADRLEERLKADKMTKLAHEIEMPLVPVLFGMEHAGIAVDKKKLEGLSDTFEKELGALTKKIYKLARREFNINSPSQLADVLFGDLAIDAKGIKKTKSGYSTAAPELEKIEDEHAIVPLIGEYREIAKLKGTYADALPLLIAEDGRIHARFNQTVAATGRLSSSNPNLQNIPVRTELGRKIRHAFVAAPHHSLLSVDYSQIELRLAAIIADDKPFRQAFRDGADIHRRTAAEVWGISESEVTKHQRDAAKAINFSILYGIGPRALARRAGFTFDEAKKFIAKYFEIHSGISDYLDAMKLKVREDGYVETLFGRRRYLPDVNSDIPQLVAASERMAINMPIQGTQADIIKMAMLRLTEWLREHKVRATLLLQVHDELVLEVADEDLEKMAKEVSAFMMHVVDLAVPLLVDVEIGKNWGEMCEWKK